MGLSNVKHNHHGQTMFCPISLSSTLLVVPNEPVGKVILATENGVFGGHLTLPEYVIVDRGAFYEVTSSASHPGICLGAFSTAST
jgi:hypothetical protein